MNCCGVIVWNVHDTPGGRLRRASNQGAGRSLPVSTPCDTADAFWGQPVGGVSGVAPDAHILPPGDLGRYAVTTVEGDRYSFKAPTLRNVALTPP